jgi:hypothetical protein
MERTMSKLPKLLGAIMVVIVTVMLGGIESKGVTFGLRDVVGSGIVSSPDFEGMPSADFNWSF